MPKLDSKGPDYKGPKTGRKLGKCKSSKEEQSTQGIIGSGEAKRRHVGGGTGKGKRINYDKAKQN